MSVEDCFTSAIRNAIIKLDVVLNDFKGIGDAQ